LQLVDTNKRPNSIAKVVESLASQDPVDDAMIANDRKITESIGGDWAHRKAGCSDDRMMKIQRAQMTETR
jgi:hypothetical protein